MEPYHPQVWARPASAQPSTRAPTTVSTINGASRASRARKEYWPRHLPPPWDKNGNYGDCSSRSGSGGRGYDDGDGYYRGRGSRPASSGKRARVPTATAVAAAEANLEVRVRTGVQNKCWNGFGYVGMDVDARRALAARAAAATAREVRFILGVYTVVTAVNDTKFMTRLNR